MSPIIREPDGPEPLPLDVDNGATPFPEDINTTRSNTLQPTGVSASKPTESAENADKCEDVPTERKEDIQQANASAFNASQSKKNISPITPTVKKGSKTQDKKGTNVNRSQSLKTRTKPNVLQNENKKPPSEAPEHLLEKSVPSPTGPISKQNKPGKFRMLRNRFTASSKVVVSEANDTKGNNSFHNLRRSQSMRIHPSKKNSTTPAPGRNSNPLKVMSESLHENVVVKGSKTQSKNAIKNSKSLTDVRQSLKKTNNHSNTNTQNGTLNNVVKRMPNIAINSRATTLSSKIKNSSEVLSTEKESSHSKNFAYKTIDVIRKSVQGKFKGNVDKRDKKKVASVPSITPKSKQQNIDNGRKNAVKIVSNSSKDRTKVNSKRKKNDSNDSDTELKPKKKASSNERLKTKALFKENRITSLSPTTRDSPKDKRIMETSKTLNNKKNDRSVLKINNKKMKGDKTAILNIKNNNNGKLKNIENIRENTSTNNSSDLTESKNVIYTSIETNPCQTSIPELQNHHALFLNNIHETLNNSCVNKHEIVHNKNLNVNEEKSLSEIKLSETLNRNIFDIISSRFSNSLPFILAETDLKNCKTPNPSEETNLTKSYSETCISERSLTVSLQEVDMKSVSPMSISNYEDDRAKVELQSPMSFANYDPYIDESMDDYWCEGEEEESYFGTLFTENKLIWESFSESFLDIDAESSNGNYYLDDGIIVNNSERENCIDSHFEVDKDLSEICVLEDSGFNFSIENVQVNEHFPGMVMKNDKIEVSDFNNSFKPHFCDKNSECPDASLTSQKPLESTEEFKDDIPDIQLENQLNLQRELFAPDNSCKSAGAGGDNEASIIINHEGEGKLSSKKSINSKKSLNESKTRRKNLKNLLRPNAINSTNRIKKLKEISKQTSTTETKLTPILRNGNMKKKALSETCIIHKKDNASLLRKEKSELEYVRKERSEKDEREKGERVVKSAQSCCDSTSFQNETKTFLLKADAKNEGSATSGAAATLGIRISGREKGNRTPPSRVLSQLGTTPNMLIDEKKRQDMPTAATRRSKIDSSKTALTKPLRGSSARTKQTDPVKVLRPAAPNSQPPTQAPHQVSDQLKKLEAELSARTQEVQSAKEEAARTSRGLEALTVLVHYLTKEYDAFSSPKFKAEVERLTSQLTDVRLCLDESTATARRLENEATERCQKQAEEIEKLEEVHRQEISSITLEHQRKTEEVLEKHQLEVKEFIAKEETKHEELIKSHKAELERIDNEWRTRMDKQHERHLQALEQLNTCHTQQLREAEASWECREKELQETNARLLKEQIALKQQAKRLEDTLLSDKDHRLQAAKRLCTALQNEVDSLKTVVEMRNSEVHKLRDQLADKERISEELGAAKERVRALQAKTEDLHAQMEKKLQLERQLIADHHSLSDTLQREASVNKRLSLENEELQWKLRQREAAAGSLPTSTLDLVTRCSSAIARQQEGCKTGALSPQFTPRSQRIGTKPHDKKWSQSFSNIPEDAGKLLRRTELQHDNVTIESPPPSPRVKAVIEKSNSVSFILDLNDTFTEDPFLGIQSPSHAKKPRTPNLQRKSLRKTFSNNLEKSSSTSLIQGTSRTLSFRQESLEVNGKDLKEAQFLGRSDSGNELNGECEAEKKLDARNTLNDGLDQSTSKFNREHSPSESSDSGDIERISPTGLSWTVPVHSNVKRYSKHIPSRFQLVPEPPRLLQQPDEDEYEEMENENEFVEVLTLGDDLSSAPLTTLFAQTPSTSVSLSDSDISQCGSRADLSTEDDCTDDEGTLLQKESQCRPQEGAGEAMIFPDAFDLKAGKSIEAIKKDCKEISKSQISSAPSSDSEDVNQPMNEEGGLNMSWSEDVECDLTSSSEMQELL